MNEEAIEVSSNAKSFVQSGEDELHVDAIEKGVPIVWPEEMKPIPRLPDKANSPFKVGVGRSLLE